MSFQFPDVNVDQTNTTALRLAMPTGAANKPANTAFTALAFIRTPSVFVGTFTRNILARNNGATSPNDSTFGTFGTTGAMTCTIRDGGVILATTSGAANPINLLPNRNYLVGLIANSGGTWLFACEPNGTPLVQALIVTAPGPFGSSFTGGGATGVFGNIGGAAGSNPWFGPLEEVCMWHGAFPEVSGAPDPAVIQALANGADLATFHTTVTPNLTPRFRYRLRDETDLADAAGVTAVLVPTNENRVAGRVGYTSGPLRPTGFAPVWTIPNISQVMFGTVGDAATATTTIGTEGGTYTGITPVRIEARLLDETQAVIRNWTTVDAAPTGGTWVAKADAFPGVLMQASYLRVEFRAIGAGEAVLASAPGYGLRGAGFSVLTGGQSQLMYYFGVGNGVALPAGARGIVATQSGQIARTTPLPALSDVAPVITEYMIASGSSNSRWARGVRQAIIEINALFPGVPVQISSVGQTGEGITAFYPGTGGNGAFALRWAAYRANLGVLQPYFLGLMGHSSGSGGDYDTRLGIMVAHVESVVGVPVRKLHFETPRYWNAPTVDSPIHEAQASRHGQRKYCLDNPATNIWCGSWASVASISDNTAGVTVDVHPADTPEGQGRGGAMIAYALMSAARAVPDVPVGITAVRAVGATAVVEFGAIN